MALTTNTYLELKSLIEAQIGSVIPPEKTAQLGSLINLAASRAKSATLFWPRTLVVGERRSINDCGYVDYAEDSYNVECCGLAEVNGLYVRNGTYNSQPRYTLYEADGTTAFYSIVKDTEDTYLISQGLGAGGSSEDELYRSLATSPASLIPSRGWFIDDATAGQIAISPAPEVYAVSTVDTFQDMHLFNAPWIGKNAQRVGFDVNSRGAYIQQGNSGQSVVYSTHRKVNTDIYGDGTAGTVSDIPTEFFDYMALYAARQYQLSARPTNGSAIFTISSSEVQQVMDDELLKIEQQNITESVGRRMQTGINTSNTLNY
jgi:hypothetical protein